MHAANWFGDGRMPGHTGNAHPNIYPYDAFATASTPVFLAVGNDRQFAQLCTVLGQSSLAGEPEFASAGARSVHRAALRERLLELLASWDGEALVVALQAKGVPCAPILDVPQALNHPHTAHRGMTVSLPGGYRGLASPVKLSRTPASYRMAPPYEG